MIAALRYGGLSAAGMTAVFVAGVCFYNVMAGINYTATSALVFQIVGRGNPLSATQYSICIAACNAAIASAVAMDGRGSTLPGRWAGAGGELLVDAVLSIVLGAVVLAVVARFGGGFPRPVMAEEGLVRESLISTGSALS